MYSNDAMIARSSQSTNSWSRKGVGRMDKQGWNCSTCIEHGRHTEPTGGFKDIEWDGCSKKLEQRFDTEPYNTCPCEHGQPVVATAICDMQFLKYEDGTVLAVHNGKWTGMRWINGKMDNWAYTTDKFCGECGCRWPTADQLPAMHEAWKKEQEGKG